MMRQYLDMIDEAATNARQCQAWRRQLEEHAEWCERRGYREEAVRARHDAKYALADRNAARLQVERLKREAMAFYRRQLGHQPTEADPADAPMREAAE